MTQMICPVNFTSAVGKLRNFFLDKGFLEVHTQNRLSILKMHLYIAIQKLN